MSSTLIQRSQVWLGRRLLHQSSPQPRDSGGNPLLKVIDQAHTQECNPTLLHTNVTYGLPGPCTVSEHIFIQSFKWQINTELLLPHTPGMVLGARNTKGSKKPQLVLVDRRDINSWSRRSWAEMGKAQNYGDLAGPVFPKCRREPWSPWDDFR